MSESDTSKVARNLDLLVGIAESFPQLVEAQVAVAIADMDFAPGTDPFDLVQLDGAGKIPVTLLPEAVLGALHFGGFWDADANLTAPTTGAAGPIPAAAPGNLGKFYIVNIAGTTTVDGISDWKTGDWIVSIGTAWGKVDSSDQVNSVAGLMGTITAAALVAAILATLRTSLDPLYEPAGAYSAINTQIVVAYTIVAADKGKLIEMNNAAANAVTVPSNGVAPLPINSRIDLVQLGEGKTSVVAGTDVTIRSSGGKLKLAGRYSGASLIKRGADEWLLIGDLVA